jgi:hypothetical protein
VPKFWTSDVLDVNKTYPDLTVKFGMWIAHKKDKGGDINEINFKSGCT